MYMIPVSVKPSDINGKGLFAVDDIKKGTIVWQYTEGFDTRITVNEYDRLSESEKRHYKKVGYLSPWSGLWVCPPLNDKSEYTNHSSDNNTSVNFDESISPEPYFYANRDINKGEEITNNYYEFDDFTRQTKPKWAS